MNANKQLQDAVRELLRMADDGAFIDLAAIDATPISRRLRKALSACEQHAITRADIERMKRNGYFGSGWTR